MRSYFGWLGSKTEQNIGIIRVIDFNFMKCEKASCRKIFSSILGEGRKEFNSEADFEYI